MNVMNLELKDIKYPPAMTIDYETFVIPGMEHTIGDESDLGDVECRTRCVITLTSKQAKVNNMNLPAKFVREGFSEQKPTTVWIVDKNLKKFKCNLKFGGRRNGEAHVRGNWHKFCMEYNLKHGSRIILGVDKEDVTLIHARIIKS